MLFTFGRFIVLVCVLVLILSLFTSASAPAAAIRVDWSSSHAPDVAGYRICYGIDGVNFGGLKIVPDPDATSRMLTGLRVGITYYFMVQSYDFSGNISDNSNVSSCEALPWSSAADRPKVPAIVGLDQPVFGFSWDVSEFGLVSGAGLEVSRVNGSFTNPNGTEWDPGSCCFTRILNFASGSSTMSALQFEGPGLYQIRVVALDAQGTIICCWSDCASLEVIAGAPPLPPDPIITGPGRGPDNMPIVRVFDPLVEPPAMMSEFSAYGANGYGVNVCSGDITGDGNMNIVTGPGPGEVYGPHVRGFDLKGTPLLGVSFMAYGTNKYGANVAVGDLDGDLIDEIITGTGLGESFGFGPHVKAFTYDGVSLVEPVAGVCFLAYGTPRWGVKVTAGDIDGDGIDEIVTGPGPGVGYGPHVRGWNVDGGTATAMPGVNYFAYGPDYQYGVNVACGDVDGDGIDEIITGPGPGALNVPHVRGWDVDVDPYGIGSTELVPGLYFTAYQLPGYGVNVSCGDIDGDGVDEIVTGPGPGDEPDYAARVRGWDYDDEGVDPTGPEFRAYDNDTLFGVKVAVGRGVN